MATTAVTVETTAAANQRAYQDGYNRGYRDGFDRNARNNNRNRRYGYGNRSSLAFRFLTKLSQAFKY